VTWEAETAWGELEAACDAQVRRGCGVSEQRLATRFVEAALKETVELHFDDRVVAEICSAPEATTSAVASAACPDTASRD
jgi:hypothetical protein